MNKEKESSVVKIRENNRSPIITVGRDHLDVAGFEMGQKVLIRSKRGEIVITTPEYPLIGSDKK